LSTGTLLLVGRTILGEAAYVAANKGLEIIDKRLDSQVRMIKEKETGDRNAREDRRKPGVSKRTPIQ